MTCHLTAHFLILRLCSLIRRCSVFMWRNSGQILQNHTAYSRLGGSQQQHNETFRAVGSNWTLSSDAVWPRHWYSKAPCWRQQMLFTVSRWRGWIATERNWFIHIAYDKPLNLCTAADEESERKPTDINGSVSAGNEAARPWFRVLGFALKLTSP